jgi:hypothetical protein
VPFRSVALNLPGNRETRVRLMGAMRTYATFLSSQTTTRQSCGACGGFVTGLRGYNVEWSTKGELRFRGNTTSSVIYDSQEIMFSIAPAMVSPKPAGAH